tara:strand:- start:239 stop:880 length:642 start_codon:yes stop_codon:yes gene_type:complete
MCLSFFVPLELNYYLKGKEHRIEITELHKFFNKNNLKDTNLKLFTNDLLAMNLWLLNGNTQLVISDALSNSLTDDKIEFNLLNTFKDFYIDEKQLRKLISSKESQYRNNLLIGLFSYKYQANSLYTYSSLENYNKKDQDLIIKTSPFRVQMQIMPETEKERIINLYKKLKINKDLLPNYVVLNTSKLFKNFTIKNNKYREIFKTKNFLIYKRL